jgi:WD40 repeat protein
VLRSPAAIGVVHEGSDRLLDEALSPDGRILAVRGDDGDVVFFDTRTLRRVGSPLAGSDQLALMGAIHGPLHGLAFSPQGRMLAVGSTDGHAATADLVSVRTHRSSASAQSANLVAADVAFAPDGKTFATGESTTGIESPPPEVIAVRDARSGRVRAETAPIPAGRLAGYTRDGRFLLVVAGKESLLLDAHTLKRAETFSTGGASALSPLADEAAFGHADGSVTLLDLRTGKRQSLSGQASGGIETASFSPDGQTLATGADDGTVAIWRLRARALGETLEGHSGPVRATVFSPDGRTLYTAGEDGSVIAWDVGGSRRLGRPFHFESMISGGAVASAVSADGSLFALSPGPNRVMLWRSATRTPLPRTLHALAGDVNGLAFSPDGKLIAAAGNGDTVLWDATAGKILRLLPGASKVAFSPDGLTVAIGEGTGAEELYDLRTGRQTGTFSTAGSTDSIDFSPDGKLLASASLTGIVTLWDVARKREARELPGAVAAYSVRFSPDGKLIAVGDSSGRVVLWNTTSGKHDGQPLAAHGGALDFAPDGKTLVTAGDDGKLRLWDVAARKLIGAPLPGSNTGGSVHFFPDGKHVLGVFGSGTAIVWNVDPAAWKAKACSVARRDLTRAEWTQFLGGRSYRNVCP